MLTINGSQQKYGIRYWETYAPVVSWPSIHFFLIITLLKKWHTHQLDFIWAYMQANIKTDLYMEIPKGFDIEGERSK